MYNAPITSKDVFPKRSAKINDGTEKPKIPLKFAKRAARYNERHGSAKLRKFTDVCMVGGGGGGQVCAPHHTIVYERRLYVDNRS